MQSIPDGVDVVSTAAEAKQLASPPLLIVNSVTEFLDEHHIGSGSLEWQRIGDGQSNITYRIRRGDDDVVLRRGPRPPLPRSTHDMIREARIQALVSREGVPVPKIIAACETDDILGVPFYVMSYLDGIVITDLIPAELASLQQRRATCEATVDTLVMLHQIDLRRGELATLGRPDGYLQRQLDRFASLWPNATLRDLPEVAEIGAWLASNIPTSQKAAIVHGDYRTGNLMFGRQAPARVIGLLDWEMATVGDPLADLGYLVATWASPDHEPTTMELTSVTRQPGYFSRDDLLERYALNSSLDLSDLDWYQVLALWKAAIFSEAIYTRFLRGERPYDTQFGPRLERGVPRLLQAAKELAGDNQTKRRTL
ncbi:MAG: aminoglycoside phosphotransferase [Subtercola sp.]|jgi:aminoglycoside phosphotransferase (APT) family kinase protein|nr:aminoglycoside phosphotransferase [Subtercola sp.]